VEDDTHEAGYEDTSKTFLQGTAIMAAGDHPLFYAVKFLWLAYIESFGECCLYSWHSEWISSLKVSLKAELKVKVSLCLTKQPCHEDVLASVLHAIFTSALEEGERSASCPGSLYPGQEPPVPIG
jgi:hypothetical protein